MGFYVYQIKHTWEHTSVQRHICWSLKTFVVFAGIICFMLERWWINTFQHVIISAKCVSYSVPYSVREKKRTSYDAIIIISSQLPCCQLYRCFFFHTLHLSYSWGSRHNWDLQGLLSKDDLQATYQGDQWAEKMSHAGMVGKPLCN